MRSLALSHKKPAQRRSFSLTDILASIAWVVQPATSNSDSKCPFLGPIKKTQAPPSRGLRFCFLRQEREREKSTAQAVRPISLLGFLNRCVVRCPLQGESTSGPRRCQSIAHYFLSNDQNTHSHTQKPPSNRQILHTKLSAKPKHPAYPSPAKYNTPPNC